MDAAYIPGGAPCHATPRHAVRIIKRNYCRPVVNNALLLKRVSATAAQILRAVSIVPENRTRNSDVLLFFVRHNSFFRDWPWLDLALSWRSDRARGNQLCEARDLAPAASRDLSPPEGREKSHFWRVRSWYTRESTMFRERGINAAVGASWFAARLFLC